MRIKRLAKGRYCRGGNWTHAEPPVWKFAVYTLALRPLGHDSSSIISLILGHPPYIILIYILFIYTLFLRVLYMIRREIQFDKQELYLIHPYSSSKGNHCILCCTSYSLSLYCFAQAHYTILTLRHYTYLGNAFSNCVYINTVFDIVFLLVHVLGVNKQLLLCVVSMQSQSSVLHNLSSFFENSLQISQVYTVQWCVSSTMV